MKTTVITTTINVPEFLKGYEANAKLYNRSVDYVVVGDLKSHEDTAAFCWGIPNCTYLDVESQERYMRRFPALANHLPLNSVERRNIGMLWAYEHGTDIFLMIDDDNFATTDDAVGGHSIVGTSPYLPTFGSSSGWYNVCSHLKEENDVEFYHRGFPPEQKWKSFTITEDWDSRPIVVNAGFWYDNPDIDAITRIERELKITGMRSGQRTFALAPGTWSPFDCQNTAIARKAVPAYFLSPYTGRYSDIWASYVIMRLAEYFEDVITFGNPFAVHVRSPHDLWKDLDLERECMILTNGFCKALQNIPISASTYHEGFGQIVDGLFEWCDGNGKSDVVEGMRLWHQVFSEIL